MNKKYSLQKGLLKALEFVIIASPALIGLLPEQWANITLAVALKLLVNYLKVKYL